MVLIEELQIKHRSNLNRFLKNKVPGTCRNYLNRLSSELLTSLTTTSFYSDLLYYNSLIMHYTTRERNPQILLFSLIKTTRFASKQNNCLWDVWTLQAHTQPLHISRRLPLIRPPTTIPKNKTTTNSPRTSSPTWDPPYCQWFACGTAGLPQSESRTDPTCPCPARLCPFSLNSSPLPREFVALPGKNKIQLNFFNFKFPLSPLVRAFSECAPEHRRSMWWAAYSAAP